MVERLIFLELYLNKEDGFRSSIIRREKNTINAKVRFFNSLGDIDDFFGDFGNGVLDIFDSVDFDAIDFGDIDLDSIDLGDIDLDEISDRIGDVFDDITNTRNGSRDDDRIEGDSRNNRLNGNRGNDTLLGLGGNDILSGGTGDDVLIGGPGTDLLSGERGNDRLQGGAAIDALYGGSGNDTLNGGGGNDLLVGGDGDNTLNGGAGRDTLILDDDNGVATIQNFNRSQDKIALPNNQAFEDVVIAQQGANATISLNDEVLAILTNTKASAIVASNFITIPLTTSG